jgi:hypothetical protein
MSYGSAYSGYDVRMVSAPVLSGAQRWYGHVGTDRDERPVLIALDGGELVVAAASTSEEDDALLRTL